MSTNSKEKYYGAVGRRKTAIARVRIYQNTKGDIVVNDKPLETYFPIKELSGLVKAPFIKTDLLGKFAVTAIIKGGGQSSQAEALRHGIARALLEYDAELRKKLKSESFLKRDPRAKERRKFGLKKARKAPQWSKR